MRPVDIGGGFVPAARSTVASVELDGEAVLYDEATRAVHRLSPTATLVWACFDGSTTLDELVPDLAQAFGADPEGVQRDLVGMARQLGALGLLEGVEADEAPAAAAAEQPPEGHAR